MDKNSLGGSVIAAIKAANIPAVFEEAIINAYRRTGGGSARGNDGKTNKTGTPKWDPKSPRCRLHRKFKDKAYSCLGGNCLDRDKTLAKPPDRKSSGSF